MSNGLRWVLYVAAMLTLLAVTPRVLAASPDYKYGENLSAEQEAKIEEGFEKLKADDYRGAIVLMDVEIAKKPHYFAYYIRGEARLNQFDYKGALEDADKALKLCGNSAFAFILRGNAYLGLCRYADACNDFCLVLQHDHKNDYAMFLLATGLFCKGTDSKELQTAGEFYSMSAVNFKDNPRRYFYIQLYLWTLHARLEKQNLWVDHLKEAAAEEEKRLSGLKDSGKESEDPNSSPARMKWPLLIGRYLLGTATETELLAGAQQSTERGAPKQHLCEAHYFIGMKALGEGKKNEAIAHLGTAVDTKEYSLVEYTLAQAILLQLTGESPKPIAPLPEGKPNSATDIPTSTL